MVDTKAFRSLSCGLYIIATQSEGKKSGCVVNTVTQVTSKPAQVSVAVNKENVTCAEIRKSGRFTVAVLDETAPMELIGTFGFHSSTEIDKFAEVTSGADAAGIPYVAEHACARMSVRVDNELDLGTHILFIGEVDESEVMSDENPMTYAYYHQVKGGKTPPKASSYVEEETQEAAPAQAQTGKIGWRCKICGYIEYVDELPDDFKCPICGKGKEMFERVEL